MYVCVNTCTCLHIFKSEAGKRQYEEMCFIYWQSSQVFQGAALEAWSCENISVNYKKTLLTGAKESLFP